MLLGIMVYLWNIRMMQWFSNYGPIILDFLTIFSGDLRGQHYIYNNIQTSSAFFIVILSWVYSRGFQRLNFIWDCNRLNVGAHMKTQLHSIKPNTKEMCKKYKIMPFIALNCLVWNTVILHKNVTCVVSMYWIYYCYFKMN